VWSGKWGVDGRREGFQRPCQRIGARHWEVFTLGRVRGHERGCGGRSPGAASLATWASRSISLSRSRRRAGGVRGRGVGFGPLLDVVQDPPHDRGVLDAGNHLDGATALVTGLDIDLAYRDVGEGRELGAEALNTRLRRCAQVIAMDGMYAGVAGAKAGHGGASPGGRFCFIEPSFAPACRGHLSPQCAVGCEDPVKNALGTYFDRFSGPAKRASIRTIRAKRVRFTRGFGTRAARRAMKSSGSRIM